MLVDIKISIVSIVQYAPFMPLCISVDLEVIYLRLARVRNATSDFIAWAWLFSQASDFIVLSGLHTANLSWQTRVGKPKLVCVNGTKAGGKHVCKLLASNRKVFADWPFTHTNSSLPCEGRFTFAV